jgi:TRAP-type transport system small permease protein
MLAKIETFSREFSKWLALLGLIGLVVLALLTIADVMMRWLFSNPIDGISDLYRLLVAVVVASFFPSAFAERGHIAIAFLSAALPPRGQKFLTVFAAFVTFAFTIVMGWQFIRYCFEVHEAGETTWLLGISVTPWWTGVTALLLLCIPVQFVVMLADATFGSQAGGHGHASEAPEAAKGTNA